MNGTTARQIFTNSSKEMNNDRGRQRRHVSCRNKTLAISPEALKDVGLVAHVVVSKKRRPAPFKPKPARL